MTSFSISDAVLPAVPLAVSGRMLSGNGRGPIGAGGFEWGSAAPGAAPQPVPVVRWCGRALFPAHGSQPGAPRRRAVPALEQSPHCLRSGAPTRPRRCPRGAKSAPGACGVTSALLCPAWRCSPGLRATHRSLHLPALQVGVPFPEPSPPPPPFLSCAAAHPAAPHPCRASPRSQRPGAAVSDGAKRQRRGWAERAAAWLQRPGRSGPSAEPLWARCLPPFPLAGPLPGAEWE